MIKNWKDVCDKNFHKSLDHRSFHFKQFEKKNQSQKNYLQEIKSLSQQSLKSKSLNLLKGGWKESEFYGTYSLFESIVVHSEHHLKNPKLQADYPINLNEPEEVLRERREHLPQFRFLLNDRTLLLHTLQLVMIGIRSASNSSTEKEKMRNSLRVIVEQLLGISGYDDMLALCHKIIQLEEE